MGLRMGAKTTQIGLNMLGVSPDRHYFLATAGCPAAGVALHAGAVADQRVIAAFAAGFALIALHFRLGARVDPDSTAGNCGGR